MKIHIALISAACGDEVVDEDQKLKHARIDDNNEFVDVECRVENQKTPSTSIRTFFVSLTVTELVHVFS